MELGPSKRHQPVLKNRRTELSVSVLSLTSLFCNLAAIKSAALPVSRCREQSTDLTNAGSVRCAGPLGTFALRSGDESEISTPGITVLVAGRAAWLVLGAQDSPGGTQAAFQV